MAARWEPEAEQPDLPPFLLDAPVASNPPSVSSME